MKSFLTEVVEDLMSQSRDFKQTTLIIPGVRPKAFLRKTFMENGFQGMLPQMLTIEEFFEQITGLKLTTGLPLWISAYTAYRDVVDEPKSFEDFLKFIPTLLRDFDDIDASLCDEKNLLDLLVSEERIKAWGKSMDVGLSEVMKNHLGFWTDAQSTFWQLRQNLLEEGKAYRGLLTKMASQDIDNYIHKKPNESYVYIGFNALTQAELIVMQYLVKAGMAKTYWDADAYYMNNVDQEAGSFLRKYRKLFPEEFKVSKNFEQPKNFKIVNIPKQETQAKYVGNYLDTLTPEERSKTAIVLADELLLPAVLNALPESVDKLNITMGLPLQMVPISNFFKELFQLHLTQEKFRKEDAYYYKNVLNLLQHSTFRGFFMPEAEELIEKLHQQNLIFVSSNTLKTFGDTNTYFSLFKKPDSVHLLLETVISWINKVYENGDLPTMDQEYLFRFRSIFMQLAELVQAYDFIDSFKVLHQLFQQLLMSESVSFVGEPLVGLQLLGVLETRLLDFEHIIMTSVNEGTLPLGRQENSFIPFDFRVEAKLNTFLDNDAIYAYHFYRLIQRSQSAVFLYNSDSEGVSSGEASRFLLQLKLEAPHSVQEEMATPNYQEDEQTLMSIPKSDSAIEALHQWKQKISPSSLASYLFDPIAFYTQKVLKVREEDEVEEIADNRTLGNIVHNVLEALYAPYLNQILDQQHFKEIAQRQDAIFKKVVNDELLKDNKARGKNIIIIKVAEEMINNVLRKDKAISADNELIIKELEKDYTREFTTPNGHQVKFYGYIDRIDQLNGVTRILDYKSGAVDQLDLNIKEDKIEKITEDYKGAKAIQLAIYTYMVNRNDVKSGIYPLRYFSRDINYLNWEKSDVLNLTNLTPMLTQIGHLIDEILDPEVAFQALED